MPRLARTDAAPEWAERASLSTPNPLPVTPGVGAGRCAAMSSASVLSTEPHADSDIVRMFVLKGYDLCVGAEKMSKPQILHNNLAI